MLTRHQTGRRRARSIDRRASISPEFRESGWDAMSCRVVKVFAIIGIHLPEVGTAHA
jgi:hypothetical protein